MSIELFQPTDIVLAKVKGYPAWPAMIIPTEIIPSNVLKTNSHIELDDSDNEDANSNNESDATNDDNDNEYIHYSKILKFKKYTTLKDFYCVKFFEDDSYIWVKLHDLKRLTLDDCESWLANDSHKQKRLIPAYEMAIRGFSKDGIDVWEFVEYGSKAINYDNDDDYTEEDTKKTTKGGRSLRSRGRKKAAPAEKSTRSSSRQRELRSRQQEESDSEDNSTPSLRVRKRMTRSRDNKTKEEPLEPSTTAPEPVKKKLKKTPIVKKKPVAVKKPIIEKYNYEDDEDWSVVGMGPQDRSINDKISHIVNKLSQKKNMEKHNETKLDLLDKLSSINKLLIRLFTTDCIKDDYEIILDEMDIALSTKGAKNEFITIFRSNNELLVNFRLLFNLKYETLNSLDLWDSFQRIFELVYSCNFIPDSKPWSEKIETKEESISPQEIDQEKENLEDMTKSVDGKTDAIKEESSVENNEVIST